MNPADTRIRNRTEDSSEADEVREAMPGPSTFALLLILATHDLAAAQLRVSVVDSNARPVADAVVSATAGSPSSEAIGKQSSVAVVAQENLQFVPRTSAIRRGTRVRFPNRDDILHNVYSFSKAKKFQLPLYRDEPPELVSFDVPGAVVLGCNIHDWMVAYIYVLDTPWFARTGASGRTLLRSVPAGDYAVEVWHPRMKTLGNGNSRAVELAEDGILEIQFQIALKPAWRTTGG